MKKLLFLLLILKSFTNYSQLNIEVDAFGGGTVSALQFKEFNTFVDSYNELNKSSLTRPMKFNPLGVGYHVGAGFRMNWFYSSLSTGYIRFLDTYAEIGDQERHFYFENYTFDLFLGGRIGKGKVTFTPHVNMTICSMNLSSFFQYENGEKSYGSDNTYGGVYTSFKMTSRVGIMTRVSLTDRLSLSIDASFFPKAKKYGGGSFDYSTSGTFGSSFPRLANTGGFVEVDDAMTETYRLFSLDIGLSILLFNNHIK